MMARPLKPKTSYRVLIAILFGVLYIEATSALEFLPEEKRAFEEIQLVCNAVLMKEETLTSEPIIFREQNVGERYRFQFEDRYSVRLDHVHPTGQPARFVAEISVPTSALRLVPLVFLGLDQNCMVQQGRYLHYEGAVAVSLDIFGPAYESVGREILNPPMPMLPSEKAHGQLLVAMVDSGVNYLLPQIQSGLARDESGNLLGYDFWDLDPLPFDSQTPGSPFFVQRHGTRTASILMDEAPTARLVPYRYPRTDMERMSSLVAHADSLGVRIIGMPLGSRNIADWVAFEESAIAHPQILFIVSAGNNGVDIDNQPVFPASLDINNMIVVTSADDFQRPAERTNWGASTVDYTVPAELVTALDFTGDYRQVSGSSYAVSRVAALAANILSEEPALSVEGLIASIQSHSLAPGKGRYVTTGYIPDTRIPNELSFQFLESTNLNLDVGKDSEHLDISVLILDERWQTDQILTALEAANEILSSCHIQFGSQELFKSQVDDHLKDLSVGTAYTLLKAFHQLRPAVHDEHRVTLVLARDSRMQVQFEAEAFGEGNTRSRRWLENSLWVTYGARDLAITIAHELFHILTNDGRHVSNMDNLMSSETSGNNVTLTKEQCQSAGGFFN